MRQNTVTETVCRIRQGVEEGRYTHEEVCVVTIGMRFLEYLMRRREVYP